MRDALRPAALFDLNRSLAGPALAGYDEAWEILPHIHDLILELGPTLDEAVYRRISDDVWLARDVELTPLVTLHGPAIIGPGTELRPGAYIRGSVIVGSACVVGNATELKNVILFDEVDVPHFNYIGDSIMGVRAHTGAGAITSNVKGDRSSVEIHGLGARLDTGLEKFGALVGDQVEIGCNAVLNPGTVVGRGTRIYPLCSVRGYLPPQHILKGDGSLVPIELRAGGQSHG